MQYTSITLLILNCCIYVDLLLTIRDPFKPRYRRIKWYVLFTLLGIIIAVLIVYDDYLGYETPTIEILQMMSVYTPLAAT